MDTKDYKKPLLLRQIGCLSSDECSYDIEHLYQRMQNNPSFTTLFIEYVNAGKYKKLCEFLRKDDRFSFLWKYSYKN